MKRAESAGNAFQVGDYVFAPWHRPIRGQIIEDRGPIGRNGRHLYSVRIAIDSEEPIITELPGEDLDAAPDAEPPLETGQVIEYLKAGGLIAVLMTNLDGGRDQPKLWLKKNSSGYVSYAFTPEPGSRGGETVPFGVLHGGNRILGPKADEVATFLESFGLDRSQADDVIRAVETAP